MNRIGLPKEKRSAVKKFIQSASIDMLFKGWEKEKIDKMRGIEEALKKKFRINSLLDYLERDSTQIIDFLKSKRFSDDDANSYAIHLLAKLGELKDSLKELNIIL